MVHPLVNNTDRTLESSRNGDTVLTENGKTEGVDHLRNTVMDLRIRVIRTAGKNNTLLACPFEILDDFLTFSSDIRLVLVVLLVSCGNGLYGLCLCNAEISKRDRELLGKGVIVIERQERIEIRDSLILDILEVIADNFRIGSYDRAVKVVTGLFVLMTLIRNIRIEDRLDALFDQCLNMAVNEFGRIADTLGRNGIHTLLEKLMVRSRRDDYGKSEFRKYREPERIVLVHVQSSRDTDLASWRLVLGQWLIAESSRVFVSDQVRKRILCLLLALTSFAAVTGDETLAVTECRDRKFTMVRAERTWRHLCGHIEIVEIFKSKKSGNFLVFRHTLLRNDRRAESTHQAGHIRSDDFTAGNKFEAAQDRVV